ncbi:QueT transporter family protein [Mobilitalea sibirica]|uniref:QueT transporter family protein n=1 Tax=Mobilitalea sibirica TaxID=1462919 RepID=A0A8J7HAE5_9FIRM|nr:QueT transporter family protein [Mobilitalea sibirica]MBH1942106.1 QueT transporter family protein [Mobilitalea sibirica]
MNKKTIFITQAAVIAALYTVLVLVFQFSSFGPIQFRVAEALTILPYFTPAAIPGVAIGCFLSAILSGADVLDIVFGSLATLFAALLSYQLRRSKFLVPIPPILVNALVIPFVLKYAYFEADPVPLMMLTVGAGQLFAAGILGMVLLFGLDKVKHVIFKNN